MDNVQLVFTVVSSVFAFQTLIFGFSWKIIQDAKSTVITHVNNLRSEFEFIKKEENLKIIDLITDVKRHQLEIVEKVPFKYLEDFYARKDFVAGNNMVILEKINEITKKLDQIWEWENAKRRQ